MKYNLELEHDINSFKTKYNYFLEHKKVVELKEVRKTRSISQNAYLHVLFSLFGIEFGYTLEETKVLIKRQCNFMSYEKNNIKFLRKTSLLNTLEMTNFIEWFRNYSSEQGLYLPSSDEYIFGKLFIDNEIEKHKIYL